VNTDQARSKVLSVLERWHRNIVWRVQYRLHSGELQCKWFRREQAARDWAKLLFEPHLVEVSYTVRECKQFGFVDDEIHWVLNP
jgi:hypothetical protein